MEPEEPGLPIRLDAYALRFNKQSDDGSGKANVESSQGSGVWGVLYAITQAELKRLNEGEKGYTAVRIAMQIPNVGKERCWVHIADANRVRSGLRPYSWYKRFLMDGARVHGLPPEYIASLEAIDAMEDSESRTRREMAIDWL